MELAELGLLDDADIDLVEAGIALARADRPDADGGRLRCVHLSIEETPTNTVNFEGNPADWLPVGASGWWQRADASINDLRG